MLGLLLCSIIFHMYLHFFTFLVMKRNHSNAEGAKWCLVTHVGLYEPVEGNLRHGLQPLSVFHM